MSKPVCPHRERRLVFFLDVKLNAHDRLLFPRHLFFFFFFFGDFYFSNMSPPRPFQSVQLLESDVAGVLPEALPADVQVVLPDEAVPVGAGAAAGEERKSGLWNWFQ